MNILIVEDNYAIRRLYARGLMREGHNVSQADSVEQAREVLASGCFDVALCDVELSKDSVFSLIPDLNAHDVPVLVISSQEDYLAQCKANGVREFLPKPVPIRVLIDHLNELQHTNAACACC